MSVLVVTLSANLLSAEEQCFEISAYNSAYPDLVAVIHFDYSYEHPAILISENSEALYKLDSMKLLSLVTTALSDAQTDAHELITDVFDENEELTIEY